MAIDPSKDVDGFHPENFGKMALDMSTFIPATPFGILELLERYNVETQGKHTVVIGRSHIVGRPMSILMGRKGFPGNSTVTLTHTHTKNINQITSQADIVISALGVPNYLKAEMIKDDAVIIDVGITRVTDENSEKGYKIVGDVDFENVSKSLLHYACSRRSRAYDYCNVIKKHLTRKRKWNKIKRKPFWAFFLLKVLSKFVKIKLI